MMLQRPQWKTFYGQIQKNENHHYQQVPTLTATKQECHRVNTRIVALQQQAGCLVQHSLLLNWETEAHLKSSNVNICWDKSTNISTVFTIKKISAQESVLNVTLTVLEQEQKVLSGFVYLVSLST